MSKTYKCVWSHCRFDNIINEDDNFVVVNGKKYHNQCNCERENINKSIALFTEQINDQIVMSQLRSVINNLIYKQGFESEYVVFAIQYAINHPECKLTYPAGLHYICKDQKIMELWNAKKDNEFKKITHDKFIAEDVRGSNIQHKTTNSNRFSSILGRRMVNNGE